MPTDRRTFLAAVTAGAAPPMDTPKPVQLEPWQAPTERQGAGPPNPAPPDQRVGFALVGLGHLTLEELLPAFGRAKFCKPTALVSGDLDKAKRVARQYGIPETSVYDYKGFDRVRDNPDVQVVYVVLPNGLHEEFVTRAAAAGKHVLCEKPMATSPAEAERMVAACAKAGKKLMIAYRLQYEPHHRWLIKEARGGRFGPLKLITASNGQNEIDRRNWRQDKKLAGGGALPDVGVYCLSFARYVTGEEPTEITALVDSTPGDRRFTEVEESVLFQLKFPSGVLADLSTSYGHHGVRAARVAGATGWANLDPGFSYRGLKLTTHRSEGKTDLLTHHDLGERDQFATEMDHMARCVLDDLRPHTPGEEGLQDQKLISAIYQAAETGRKVTLPPVAGKDAFRGPPPAG